jgi:programmed cell death protein 5
MSDELDEIRKKRLRELQNAAGANEQEEELRRQRDEAEEAFERQKQVILRTIMTDEAKQRLSNIKLVKPEMAENIENQLVQLAQSGRLSGKITEEQLLRLLKQIQDRKRDSKIKFKRV